MIGMFVMKAIPLHLGHIHAINIAASQCKQLFIVLCHSDFDNLAFNGLKLNNVPYKQRYKWLLEIYQDIPNIHIVTHCENNIPIYPHGWSAWSHSVKQLLKKYSAEPTVWFSSEKKDKTNAEHYFPGIKFKLIDPERKEVPISATKIRENGIYKYWNFLPGVVRPFFAKKVVLIGTESTGKSTLTRFLAKKYNTSWTEEYGRKYVEKYCFNEEDLLTFEDFGTIAQYHKIQEAEALRSANKVTFIDTEAITTQFYCRLYNKNKSNPIVHEIAKAQKYDLWLYLQPDVPWVADEMRQHPKDRAIHSIELRKLCTTYGVKLNNIKSLEGNYHQRMEKAITYVNALLL